MAATARETPRHDESAFAADIAFLENPVETLSSQQQEFLAPLSPWENVQRRCCYSLTWWGMRTFYRLKISGFERLPDTRPLLLAPNHASSLDPFILAAAVPQSIADHTYWVGRKGALLASPLRRKVNRLAHAVPIDRTAKALAVGAAILRDGNHLVWFPEGTRSASGRLRPLKRGIALLSLYYRVPVVPILIEGAYEAMPRTAHRPRLFAPLAAKCGPPLDPGAFIGSDEEPITERSVDALIGNLRSSLLELGAVPEDTGSDDDTDAAGNEKHRESEDSAG